jgi:hypothetical protein
LLRRNETPINGVFTGRGFRWRRGRASSSRDGGRCPGGTASERWITSLLGAPGDPEARHLCRCRRGIFGYASIVGGRFDALLFLGRTAADLLERGMLADLLGEAIDPRARARDRVAARRGAHRNRPIAAGRFAHALQSV